MYALLMTSSQGCPIPCGMLLINSCRFDLLVEEAHLSILLAKQGLSLMVAHHSCFTHCDLLAKEVDLPSAALC